MFQTLKRDSSGTRPALADYVLLFRKPGENAVPIKNDVDNETWIEWARPIWRDIREVGHPELSPGARPQRREAHRAAAAPADRAVRPPLVEPGRAGVLTVRRDRLGGLRRGEARAPVRRMRAEGILLADGR